MHKSRVDESQRWLWGMGRITFSIAVVNKNLLAFMNRTTTVLRPLYSSTSVSQHLQLKSRILLVHSFTARMPLLTQPAHMNVFWKEDDT